ncbi:MAG: DUF4433 domain-containing protein [Verrucomicrobia bacterium]|nr:DUF4433 domain-containing protein [Verrucomicrobiota bacterium]MCH8512980.1 DUF4433 domain-containing protein [Kiritimatiellia bacterium]
MNIERAKGDGSAGLRTGRGEGGKTAGGLLDFIRRTAAHGGEGASPKIWEIVILRSYAESVAHAGLGFVFTNGHAVMAYTQFFDDLAQIPSLPWDAIRAKYWNDFVDGRCDCQSEFLVRDFFPLCLVDHIGVFDEDARARCSALSGCPAVAVERTWFF